MLIGVAELAEPVAAAAGTGIGAGVLGVEHIAQGAGMPASRGGVAGLLWTGSVAHCRCLLQVELALAQTGRGVLVLGSSRRAD